MRFSINIPNFGDFADARTVATVRLGSAGLAHSLGGWSQPLGQGFDVA
jgi:hypothetical protein